MILMFLQRTREQQWYCTVHYFAITIKLQYAHHMTETQISQTLHNIQANCNRPIVYNQMCPHAQLLKEGAGRVNN